MSKYRKWKPKAEGAALAEIPIEVAITPPTHEEVTLQLANTLREARLAKRMSRGELAEEIGYDDRSILRWEHTEHPTYPEDMALQALKMYFRPHLDRFPYRGRRGVVRG